MSNTLQEAVDIRRSKGQSDAEIIDYLVGRSDRQEERLAHYKQRYSEMKEALKHSQFESGRRVKVTVDNIIRTCWGNYLYHKNTRYCYDGKVKAWVKDTNKNSLLQYNLEHIPGKFHIEIILPDEEMPEVFIGKCTGSVLGKKLIMAEGHMIGYGDEFELRKKRNVI